MLMTKNQAEKWFDNSLGKQFNPDGWYGFQCYDYANMFFMLAFSRQSMVAELDTLKLLRAQI